ncbi:MAG TPA: penicillin-binding protein 2 [Pseudolysinimonas sp.]|nr:penicillin-binding protein 2 [Pseudolysinimonas sp.]
MINPRGTRRRLAITILAVFAIVAVFVIRLVDIQVVRAAELTDEASQRRTGTVTTYGVRGSILDANGVVLADSVERFNITAAPNNFDKALKLGTTWMRKDGELVKVPVAEAVEAVANAIDEKSADLYSTLTADPSSSFVYLTKSVTLKVFKKVRDLNIGWIYSELNPARTYPSGSIAGNLVGYVGTEGAQAGVELTSNSCLAATNGKSTFESSRDGVRMPGSTIVQTQAKDGGDVELTIDADLQWYAQQALAEQGTALGAEWATATVVEVKTGRMVVAADWPYIDPNDRSTFDSFGGGSRLFAAPFEPGSIIKVATFAALLNAGKITPSTPVTVPGRYTDGLPAGASIKDAWAHDTINLTATGVLMNSSNIGTAILGTNLTKQQRHDALTSFGFNKKTEVGFNGESSGIVKPVDQTDAITAVTQEFGQGMSATSAQVASMYQTLGNGGVRMPLTLVDGCRQADGTLTDQPSPTGTRVVSEYAANTTVQMMETVASQGSLKNVLTIPGYRVAAKTGTAQVAENGRYGSDRIVSVAGLVPAENPEYAIVVTFAKPDTMKTSAAAAPTFNAIMKQVIKTFRITPSTTPAPSLPLTW